MSDASQKMRKLIETLHEYDVEAPTTPKSTNNPLSHIPDRAGKSHVVKKSHERSAADAVNYMDKILSYVDKMEELDPKVRGQLQLRAEELIQKLA